LLLDFWVANNILSIIRFSSIATKTQRHEEKKLWIHPSAAHPSRAISLPASRFYLPPSYLLTFPASFFSTLTRLLLDWIKPRARRWKLVEGRIPTSDLDLLGPHPSVLYPMPQALCAKLQSSSIRNPNSAIRNRIVPSFDIRQSTFCGSLFL